MIRFKRNCDAWQTNAAELSQQGSPTVSGTRVRITGTPKREEIFIPTWAFLPMATRTHDRIGAIGKWKPDLAYIGAYPFIGRHAATRAREDEPRAATLGEHVKRGPKGLQVFVRLTCKSRNRERHSSFFGPLPSSILFFVQPARSGTAAAVAQFRSKIRTVAVI